MSSLSSCSLILGGITASIVTPKGLRNSPGESSTSRLCSSAIVPPPTGSRQSNDSGVRRFKMRWEPLIFSCTGTVVPETLTTSGGSSSVTFTPEISRERISFVLFET